MYLLKPPYDMYVLTAYCVVGLLLLRPCIVKYQATLAAYEGRFTGSHLTTLKASTVLGLLLAWITWTAIFGTLLALVASGVVYLIRS